jgi:hypothetical protein
LKTRLFDDLDGLVGVDEPFEVELAPLHGGKPLGAARAELEKHGRVRFRPTSGGHVIATVTPGEEPERLVALTMIARSDERGVARAILSALDEVDEIVVGIDGRSDEITRKIAEALADRVYVFGAQDIELSEEDWQADRIHFANARNIGRAMTSCPWSLFLDSDEFIDESEPLRDRVRALDPEVGAFELTIKLDGLDHRDPQRFARTRFRFQRATHNLLTINGVVGLLATTVVHDTKLRSRSENDRRLAQRDAGMEAQLANAENGDLSALFHLAKHRLAAGNLVSAIPLVDKYRQWTEVHGLGAEMRAWLALTVATVHVNQGEYLEAEKWAVRSLFDGPMIEAFVLLGDIAVSTGDPLRGLGWFEAACALPVQPTAYRAHVLVDTRFDRRDELRRLLEGGQEEGAVIVPTVNGCDSAEAGPQRSHDVMAGAEQQ